MSLSTVAAALGPDEKLSRLPASRPERFQRRDFLAAAIVFLVTLGVYLATMAPNVTLEDSGELITGAVKFGVPHPPGYPLWTMAGFLISHLVPFGNLAWRINLESAIFGAAACAVLTLLVCHSGRWLLQRWTTPEHQPAVRCFCFYGGMFAGLVLGFSDIMWSQSVISEVYSLNALFVNAVLLLFYFWMLEPAKTHRLILTVFVFGLGLTNHHTLIQMIPAILLASACRRGGQFASVLTAVNLFSLSILVYLSWLSDDGDLQKISYRAAWVILVLTALLSIFNLRVFRAKGFAGGAALGAAILAYGYFFMRPVAEVGRGTRGVLSSHGWLQISTGYGFFLALFLVLTLGLLFSSVLNRRLIVGVFVAGWVGLTPYAYESFASGTHPPMNWGYASERSGFYYAVSRQQYPMSLPDLIKQTIGHGVGVGGHAESLEKPNYLHRLLLTFYYYGDNLQDNFTVPLIALTLAILVYLRRCDPPQLQWFLFLAVAFFFLGFMLHLIEPPEAFDFERNLQYKVFHLQSHCIFVLLMGYGAIAAMTYLYETLPEFSARFGPAISLGVPALYLALLPLWSNFDDGNQAGHWFGYQYGRDLMAGMDRNAVYFGGSDAGRFVPTYMAFVESQQSDRWKRDPSFDRRDVTVITQNAVCDVYYCQYIRDQYDERFRPTPDRYTRFEKWLGRPEAYPTIPVTCLSTSELSDCWAHYESLPNVAARLRAGQPVIRPGTDDVFEVNGLVAFQIFIKNKARHTFYLEQSIAIDWMYGYLLPCGLIFKLNPEPMAALPPGAVEQDRKFWDDYAAKLLADPFFRVDDDATITFGKLAYWHADLYRWRGLPKEEEYWLRLALKLSPQAQGTVQALSTLLTTEKRFDEALAVLRQAQVDDPRNESYDGMVTWVQQGRDLAVNEASVRAQIAKRPYDVDLNLQLARYLDAQGNSDEAKTVIRHAAALTNWDRPAMSQVVQFYVDNVHHPEMAIAFLEERVRLDPKSGEMAYSLAALNAALNHRDEALKYFAQSIAVGGTNAIVSAKIDPRFQTLGDDPRFQALLGVSNAPPANPAPPLPKKK